MTGFVCHAYGMIKYLIQNKNGKWEVGSYNSRGEWYSCGVWARPDFAMMWYEQQYDIPTSYWVEMV